jgi:predicted HAD superfamily phosphohydrolase
MWHRDTIFRVRYQLPSTIAQVNGKKELTGRTGLDVAVSNHYGRLIAHVMIVYNSMQLSGLLSRYLATDSEKALNLLRRISPVA